MQGSIPHGPGFLTENRVGIKRGGPRLASASGPAYGAPRRIRMADPTTYEAVVAEAAADPRVLVRAERSGAVATVTLDDPKKYNVLSAPLTVQLRRHLTEL